VGGLTALTCVLTIGEIWPVSKSQRTPGDIQNADEYSGRVIKPSSNFHRSITYQALSEKSERNDDTYFAAFLASHHPIKRDVGCHNGSSMIPLSCDCRCGAWPRKRSWSTFQTPSVHGRAPTARAVPTSERIAISAHDGDFP
jgi:hypothetical protein